MNRIDKPYQKTVKELLELAESSIENGLINNQVVERAELFGPNTIVSGKKTSAWRIFFNQFQSLLIYILLFASGLSFYMKDMTEAIAILIVVVLNALLGFVQEYRADASIKAIQSLVNPECTVVRDGTRQTIPNEELVPGDIVLLESGNKIPADIRILSSTEGFKVDESMLTGESLSILKNSNVMQEEVSNPGDVRNQCYMGTIVTEGKAKGMVVSTGGDTELGKIASLTGEVKEEKTPLEKRMDIFSKNLTYILGFICALVFVLNIIQGDSFHDTLLFAIALAVAAIPESLPAVTTIVLSNGVSRMSKHNAIVKRLASVETLGSTTVICTDKTGTLTENNMKAIKIFANLTEHKIPQVISEDSSIQLLQEIFYFDNDAVIQDQASSGDPTEIALLEIGQPLQSRYQDIRFKRSHEIPFDSTRKMMSVTIHKEDEEFFYTKGAWEQVAEKCNTIFLKGEQVSFTPALKKRVNDTVVQWSQDGYRILAGAYKKKPSTKQEEDLVFVGIAALRDPIRTEVFTAIQKCQDAGIRVIMVTGDHAETAKAYAKELKISQSSGKALTHEDIYQLSDQELLHELKTCSVFARINPEDKYRIVSLLKSQNEVVAMTGDGVNDAPALRKADIGVAMGLRGTDLAREVSELVLLDDNFATIVHAIEEGRVIYDNIKNTIFFLLSCNIGEILLVFTAILFGMPAPLGALQLLWLNLITDSFPAIALGFEKAGKGIMNPRKQQDNQFLNRSFMMRVTLQGVLIAGGAFWIYFEYYYSSFSNPAALATTACFAGLIMIELFRALSARSQKRFLFEMGFFSNTYVIFAQIISFGFLLLALYGPIAVTFFQSTPIQLQQWINILIIATIVLISAEVQKLILRK
ncbi:MAG: cation-translocating P-type ATPase [Caldisericia bacterium]|nr:cation-translocating P-type ATPase [Caldisericia bacterium]